MTGRALLLAAGLALAAVPAGCGPSGPPTDPSLAMDVSLSPTPPMTGEARVRVALSDTAGRPVEDARVTVTGLMSHAGMVPVRDTAEADAPGRYLVPDFDFTMAGDWLLEVRATLPDGRVAARDVPVRVVARSGLEDPR